MIRSTSLVFTAIAMVSLLAARPAAADDIAPMLDNVKKFVDEKNYAKALEELTWVRKEIEKLNSGSLAKLLPEKLGELQGAEAEIESAMGITNIRKTYTGGDVELNFSLTQTGAGGGMSGLAGMGAMAALLGNSQNAVRVAGRTAQVEDTGDSTRMMLYLKGGMIELVINQADAGRKLKVYAEALPLDKLDASLQGE